MKYFCIEIILFVSINIYSQEFLTNDSIFSDTLKYEISLPQTHLNLQNAEKQLKASLNSNFDLEYALDFQHENKNAPLPYSTSLQNIDFQQYKDTDIFLKNFRTQINQEFEKNRFSFQKFEYQSPNISGFQKADMFPNSLKVNLFENENFSIESSRYSFTTGYEGINSAGVKLSWKANERLKLSLQPNGGRYYYGLDVRPNYFFNLNVGIDYKISERLNFLLNTNYTFAGKTAPPYAPNIYPMPSNSIYGGMQVQLTDWLALQGGVNVVKEPSGKVSLLPLIIPIIDWAKLLGIKKKKKKPVIPQWWY